MRGYSNDLTAERLRELLNYDPIRGNSDGAPVAAARQRARLLDAPGGPGSYRIIRVDRVIFLAHRLAWLHSYGVWPTKDIDHIDGDKTNNRIVNLREATRAQNVMNVGPRRDNRLPNRGVSRLPHGKFNAGISRGTRRYHLGNFETAEDASAAYQKAAREIFGDFVRTPTTNSAPAE